MAFFQNLVDRFAAAEADLYSLAQHPYKASADLNPIVVYAPNDPARPQGIGNSDPLVPVEHVLTDQRRFAKYLTSPRGLTFFVKQVLLQSGNAISETRVLDPTFVNKNLSPYVHAKRQLFDQTDVVVNAADRSPASTPDVGIAGRLQKQTGADALMHIMGRTTARQTIVDVLSSTQIAQTISGVVSAAHGGTFGINQRPEFDVSGRWYSAVLYAGRTPMLNRELNVVIDALGAAGYVGSLVGLPNFFRGLSGKPPLPSTSNFSTGGSDPLGVMPYFNPDIPGVPAGAGRYVDVKTIKEPGLTLPGVVPAQIKQFLHIGLTTIVKNLFGFNFGSASRFASVTSFKPTVALGPEIALATGDDELAHLRKPERSLRQRYEQPQAAATVLSPVARNAVTNLKSRLDTQAAELKTLHPDYATEFAKRGFIGGVTLTNADQFKTAGTYTQAQEVRKGIAPHGTYLSDVLNLIPEVSGTTMPTEINGAPVPTDIIKVRFVDTVNGRTIPFRALLEGLTETVSTEYSTTRYIGRTERNILYLGASRALSFTLYVHAWSPSELQAIWKRVNTMTGLCFPATYSPDGFMIPPIVKLTIGDFYVDQPGYLASVVHSIEDGTSWEITDGSQVPMTVKIGITFEVIEKHSMHAQAPFYGFGFPVTNQQAGKSTPSIQSVIP